MTGKSVTVLGATGSQGGSVVKVLLKAGYKVRAVTRNPTGDAGKGLSQLGAEVVQGNIDDEASLAKAFEGAYAIFAVTNFWEHLFTGSSQQKSGELEAVQAKKIATTASKVSTLEHFIWSTLPNAKKLSGGKHPVAHLDYKAEVDEWIRESLPDLAKKTTYLYFGYYPSNMIYFPLLKPFPAPNGKYIQLISSKPDALMPISGDMNVNPGLWVRGILEKGSGAHGKYAFVVSETISMEKILSIWGEVTGKETAYVEVDRENFKKLWGLAGDEMTDQFKFGETQDSWATSDFLTAKDLGIESEVVGLKAALENLKGQLL